MDPEQPPKPTRNSSPPGWRAIGPRRLALYVFLVVTAALAGSGARKVTRHVTVVPAFCVSCHSSVPQALKGHPHSKLPCSDCHSAQVSTGLRLLAQSLVGMKGNAKGHGALDKTACKNCHLQQQKQSIAARSAGHRGHVLSGPKLDCSNCHELENHQTANRKSACNDCHKTVAVHDSGMTSVPCLSCHQFLSPNPRGTQILATGCPACHSGSRKDQPLAATRTKPVTPEQVHGNVNACRLCHNPHEADPNRRRQGPDCNNCHRGVVEQHAKAGISGHKECSLCHEIHGPRPKTPDLCVKCHENKLTAKTEPQLSGRHPNCGSCHQAHAFKVEAPRCASCHEAQKKTLASWKAKTHSNCLSCHQGHSAKKAAQVCVTCHAAAAGHGHPACTTCHDPHQNKSGAKACASCHQGELAAASHSRVAQHRVCASCHALHAAPLAPQRCKDCHAPVAAKVVTAGPKPHQNCASCHQPHSFQASATSCKTCHKETSLGAHKQVCTGCHEPHGAPGRPTLECRKCHTAVPEIGGKHAACTTCHSVHAATQGGPNCASCHSAAAAGAKSWKPPSHQGCQSCHSRHAPASPKNCGECHGDKVQKPLFKGHSCMGCHNPHAAPQTSHTALCGRCHTGQASATAGMTGKHSDCVNCHQPHSNVRPACGTCHQQPRGAHAVPKHGRCSDCHGTHQVHVSGREICMKCHQDKSTHYPKAATCVACHLFK